MPPVLINGISYSWSQLAILIGNNVLYGITELNFEMTQNKTVNKGIGQDGISIGYGDNDYKGSFGIYLEDWKRLIAVSPNGSPLYLSPFTIKAIYSNPGIPPTTDILYNVSLLNDGNDLKQGDTKFIKTVNFIYVGQAR